jgi:hypothetical protein
MSSKEATINPIGILLRGNVKSMSVIYWRSGSQGKDECSKAVATVARSWRN